MKYIAINMENKVDFVLLIDDDKATNFFNSIIIQKHHCFKEAHYVQSGYEALEYLKEAMTGKVTKPDLIFLDINMPGMNGWDFLTNYEKLNPMFTLDIKVILLSTSSDPTEVSKSMTNYKVDDFISKPLSGSLLNDVLETHFKLTNH